MYPDRVNGDYTDQDKITKHLFVHAGLLLRHGLGRNMTVLFSLSGRDK
jgi:hypothetical protein